MCLGIVSFTFIITKDRIGNQVFLGHLLFFEPRRIQYRSAAITNIVAATTQAQLILNYQLLSTGRRRRAVRFVGPGNVWNMSGYLKKIKFYRKFECYSFLL